MVQAREVVITGLGLVTPIGIGKDTFWSALLENRSGVGPLSRSGSQSLPAPFGAELRQFEPKQYVRPRKNLKVMCREVQIGFAAAQLAVEDAGLAPNVIDPERLGVVFGADQLYSDIPDLEAVYRSCIVDGRFDYQRWGDRAMSEIHPLWMLKYLPNMPACHIGIAHDARGPNNSITHAEVSSLLALSEGAAVIQRGHADAMIVGGTGSRLNLMGMLSRGDRFLSHRDNDPAGASRPFDQSRDGMVNGEGSAAYVIESRICAEKRGARVLARVLGHGNGFAAGSNGSSGPAAAIGRAMRQALRSARISPAAVGHVNAAGLSTVEDDIAEAQAIHDLLGKVPVTAPTSYFGHLGAGAGAVEMAVSVLGMLQGRIPPTLNYQNPDPRCPVQVIHGRPLQSEQPVAMLLNHTRTGQAAAAILAGP